MLQSAVIPIAQTVINWPAYQLATKQALHMSITKALDKAGMKTDDIAAFVVTLMEIQDDVQDPVSALREASSGVLKHASVSFLAIEESETLCDLREETDLAITTGQLEKDWKIAVISGNLDQWRSALINCCSDRVSKSLRLLADRCLLFFEQAGLSYLWSYLKKSTLNDQTFKLVPKR